jgi:hypothetical protein
MTVEGWAESRTGQGEATLILKAAISAGSEGAGVMLDQKDRIYYARRAAEELELALAATDPEAEHAHRELQRAYLEKASVGDRPVSAPEVVG